MAQDLYTQDPPRKGHPDWVMALTFIPNTTLLASGGITHEVIVWDLDEGGDQKSPHGKLMEASYHSNWIRGLDYVDNTLVTCGDDGMVYFYGLEDNLRNIGALNVTDGNGYVHGVCFTPDATRERGGLFTCGDSKENIEEKMQEYVKLWDLASDPKSHVRSFTGMDGKGAAVSQSPDGKLVCGGSYGSNVLVWDIGTGKVLHEVTCNETCFSVEWKDDQSVLFGAENGVYEWNIGETEASLVCPAPRVRSIALYPDGSPFVLCAGVGAKIFDLEQEDYVFTLVDGEAMKAAVVSPDSGRFIAATGNNGAVYTARREHMPMTKAARKR
jgi:WD40 repeat protein